MERSEVEAIHRLVEQHRKATTPERPARPTGLILIAGLQLLKSAALLLTGTLLRVRPEMLSGPDSPLYSLLYLATRGRFALTNAAIPGDALAGVVALLGLYLGAIGIGILHLRAWARRALIFSCGLTLALWMKSSLWPDPAASASPELTGLYVLLALDASVFIYLLRGNTAEIFSPHG